MLTHLKSLQTRLLAPAGIGFRFPRNKMVQIGIKTQMQFVEIVRSPQNGEEGHLPTLHAKYHVQPATQMDFETSPLLSLWSARQGLEFLKEIEPSQMETAKRALIDQIMPTMFSQRKCRF